MSEQTITEGVGARVVVEGLPWVQTARASQGVPIWKLDLPAGGYWVLKDYGRHSLTSAFTGVRLVSGGPVVAAGKWDTIPEAMVAVADWLRVQIRADLERRKLGIEASAAAVAATEEAIS